MLDVPTKHIFALTNPEDSLALGQLRRPSRIKVLSPGNYRILAIGRPFGSINEITAPMHGSCDQFYSLEVWNPHPSRQLEGASCNPSAYSSARGCFKSPLIWNLQIFQWKAMSKVLWGQGHACERSSPAALIGRQITQAVLFCLLLFLIDIFLMIHWCIIFATSSPQNSAYMSM